MREQNGQKVFWSRGNGWVIAGLVRVLEHLPHDYPNFQRYLDLFLEMSETISSIQQTDGFWKVSLLDPESFPGGETSGSALFCYALAWGINHGYLPEDRYLPIVLKSWKALSGAVNTSGKLGWVQPMGVDPQLTQYKYTDVFGVGAFLLAGSEVVRLL